MVRVIGVQSGCPGGDCRLNIDSATQSPHLTTDCASNPTERTRPHHMGPTVRLNRWWRFPSALWSAATHVYGDTNGDGKGADLALGCRVSELKEDINNAFHQLV